MKPVHRLGDLNEDDGEITDVIQQTVFANNLPISVDGSDVEDGSDVTANGSPTVFIAGIPVNRQGDEDEDGSARAEGSPNVFVGDGAAGGGAGGGAAGGGAGGNTGAGAGGGAAGGGAGGDAGGNSSPSRIAPPDISDQTLAGLPFAMGQTVTSAMLDLGNANRYPRLPFGGNDSSGSVAAVAAIASARAAIMTQSSPIGNYELSDQAAKDLETNYLDKILNSQALTEKYPSWPRLPYGGNNAQQ